MARRPAQGQQACSRSVPTIQTADLTSCHTHAAPESSTGVKSTLSLRVRPSWRISLCWIFSLRERSMYKTQNIVIETHCFPATSQDNLNWLKVHSYHHHSSSKKYLSDEKNRKENGVGCFCCVRNATLCFARFTAGHSTPSFPAPPCTQTLLVHSGSEAKQAISGSTDLTFHTVATGQEWLQSGTEQTKLSAAFERENSNCFSHENNENNT